MLYSPWKVKRVENREYKFSYKLSSHATSLSVYNVGRQKCEPGYRWGPGVRDHYLIHYVVSGKGTLTASGKTCPVGTGAAFLIYPDETVCYQADEKDPWEYFWVGFRGNDARLLLAQTDFSPETPVLTLRNGETPRALLGDIYECRGTQPYQLAAMTGRLYVFLSYLMSLSAPKEDDNGLALVRRAAEYIAGHFSHAITADDVARHVSASRSWLYRCFMRHLGVGVSRYLTEYRVDYARLLLESTRLSVQQIALSVGYEDPYYFSRVFRQITGLSPRAYALDRRARPDAP